MLDISDIEQNDLSKDPTDLLRQQVMLLREMKESLQILLQAQTKTSEEISLLAAAMQNRSERTRIKISNVDIPIGPLIKFQLNWIIASIPVLIVVTSVAAAVGGIIWYVLRSMGVM